MKKVIFTLIAVIGIALGAGAQKAQLQLGYGGYTMMDACDMHNGGAINTAWGALTAGVNFKVMPKLWLGASYTFSSASYKHWDKANAYYHVIMLNGRYDYYRNNIVTLYGHLGLGVDITHISDGNYMKNKAYFAMQASPLGAEVGITRNLLMFGELGFGAQGLLQVGVRMNI